MFSMSSFPRVALQASLQDSMRHSRCESMCHSLYPCIVLSNACAPFRKTPWLAVQVQALVFPVFLSAMLLMTCVLPFTLTAYDATECVKQSQARHCSLQIKWTHMPQDLMHLCGSLVIPHSRICTHTYIAGHRFRS